MAVIITELLRLDVLVGDALLRAAETEFEHAVKCLLEYAEQKPEDERDRIINCRCEGSDFHPLLTPIMRAAQKNNYSIVKRLLDAGARIPETKYASGSGGATTVDSLLQSVGLVEQYSAIATPAYVTQAYNDPIDKAFQLTKTLNKISYAEVEHKLVFQEMAKKMEQLAADLISEARNTNEILTVLKYSERAPKKATKKNSSATVLPKISRAIKYKQKRFVAEPNCQQAASTQFRRQLVGVGDWSAFMQLLLLFGVILSHPLLSIAYKMGVRGSLRNFIRTPYVKFMMHLGSDIALLSIITAKGVFVYESMEVKIFEICILLAFAIGIGYKTLTYLVVDRLKFFSNFSHYRDLLIASLLIFQCLLEGLQIYEFQAVHSNTMEPMKPFVERHQNEVTVLSKPILALVSVLAFLRIMPYLTANDLVGAFQISLGDMIVNTSHFFVILIGVFIAFSSGMTYIYSNTIQGSRDLSCEFRRGDCSDLEVHFNNIGHATLTLFWTLFGMIGIDILSLPANQRVQQIAGVGMFVLFHLLAVLVLLNALIAVMSNVYNAVEENGDVEWKYSRTALWMSFMDDMFTVPPPFNLIPDVRNLCRHCHTCWTTEGGVVTTPPKKEEDDVDEYRTVGQEDYERVIKQLMERYVTKRLTTEQSANSEIGPMDIRDLRNDVASLRFDVTAKLVYMEEAINSGNNQSDKIYGQSEEAGNIFDRTLEIDQMVNKYKYAITEIYHNVEKYKDFIPALEQLNSMMDTMMQSESKSSAHVYGSKLVPNLVRRYEKAKKPAPKEGGRRSGAFKVGSPHSLPDASRMHVRQGAESRSAFSSQSSLNRTGDGDQDDPPP
eukprot:XP_798568.2 PREDICTED: short transient receptor potential channel 4 [Strongylocentrotus purpuratus]